MALLRAMAVATASDWNEVFMSHRSFWVGDRLDGNRSVNTHLRNGRMHHAALTFITTFGVVMVASQVAGARVGHDRQRYDSGRCTRTRSRVIRGYSAMVRGVSRKRQGDAQRPSMPWARHVLGAIGSSVHVLRPTQTCVCPTCRLRLRKRLCVIASFVTDRAAAARHRVAARSVCRR
ncbi:hypothetical protein, partial [Xanthomonas perforans]|uniref:hypothetical protein n=1 Tax=Xanthomonas perforans TaxID=442694 RepID=UPI001F2D409A